MCVRVCFVSELNDQCVYGIVTYINCLKFKGIVVFLLKTNVCLCV